MGHCRSGNTGSAIRIAGPVLDTTTHVLDLTAESADCAESAALEIARRGGLQETALEHVGLAVHEITLNAVVHGNRSNVHGKIVVTISRTPDKLKVVISDHRNGLDPDRLLDSRPLRGLPDSFGGGVFLARAFMDEFCVRHDRAGWTTVTMIKYL
jgi:anti-sigma regulatory factor (Ser/Thr protein kinase)